MGNTVSAAAALGSNSSARLADPGKELLRCAEQGDTRIVSWILTCDAHYLTHSSVLGGNTAWHKAAKSGRIEVLEAMEGIVTQQFQRAAQHVQVGKGDGRFGLLRLGASPAEVTKRLINKANRKGITPLMLACLGRHTETVAWLLKHGADAWRHDRVRRQTALHCAALSGATDAIRLLLASAGAELHPVNGNRLVEQGNHAGLTALHYAVFCDQQEVMHQLLAAEADITVQAEFPDLDWGSVNAGDTVMHIAATKGNIDSIHILLRAYNERSGSMMPGSGLPRRVRDPRAMRNDYGRMPYHLAVRKGYSWLAEMLDPSVPVRYILAGEELATDTTWGPPRLATIAASVLHQALISDLKAIKDLAAVEEIVAAAASTGAPSAEAVAAAAGMYSVAAGAADSDASPAAACPAAPDTSEQSEPLEPELAAVATADDSSIDATAGQRRRWSLAIHRRSSSFGTGGRPASRGAAAAAVSESPARPSSRRAAHSRRGSRGAGEFGPPPSPLSPCVLMSVMLGAGTGQDQDGESAAVSPKPHLTEGLGTGELPLQLPNLLLNRNRAPGAGTDNELAEQQQQYNTMLHVASSNVLSMIESFGVSVDREAECHASSAPRAVQEVAAISDMQQQQEQQQQANCQQQESSSSCDQGLQSSPRKCLQTSVMQTLLQQCRWADVIRPGPTEADELGEDGQTCGVCLDAVPNAAIVPCKHTMCADCAADMCERFSLATAVCPFCRCAIRGFAPAPTWPA